MGLAMIDDNRHDDSGERPSHVEARPPTVASCGHPNPFRRDLCRSCHRKFDEADLLPPIKPGPQPTHPLRRWLGTLSTAMLLQLKVWIDEIERDGTR